MNWMYLSALLQAILGIGLLFKFISGKQARREVAFRLGKSNGADRNGLLHGIGSSQIGKYGLALDSETGRLLDQLGWRKPRQKSLFILMQLGLPLLLMFLVLLYVLLKGGSTVSPWGLLFFALGAGYLIPKRLLVIFVKKRQARLAEEIDSALPMLRVFFEVGMVVEQALRVLATEGRHILPVLSEELHQLIQRLDAGMDLRSELRRTAALMDVEELTDCFMVLEQLAQQGSGAMSSLLSMKRQMDKRRITLLQEQISKMSAKMSIVMITFLFPSLLIVLAGPGFVAIIQAIKDIA